VKGTWERIPPIDDPHFARMAGWFQCAVVNRKLVLIDGNRKSLYIYDFESVRWSRGDDMPTPRFLFACSVDSSTGLVYVAGGTSKDSHPLVAAESYNVEENKWEILPPMIQPHGGKCHGVFMEGKFMVLSGGEDRSAKVFEPSAGTWRRWEDMSFRGDLWRNKDLWRMCVASYSGELYAFGDRQVMKYDGDKKVWTIVASLPQYVLCVTQWRDWIFVSGGGPSKNVCYLFKLSTGQWIEVKGCGGECMVTYAYATATMEI
jgi:WD40 repeat protein